MDIPDYLRLFRRNWRLLVAVTICFLLAGAVATMLMPRSYDGEAELFVSTASGDSVAELAQGGSFTQRQVTTYADIVSTPIILGPVIEELGLDTSPVQLAERIRTTVPDNTVLIRIIATDADPVVAADLANTVSQRFALTLQDLERASSGQSPVKATLVRPAVASESPATPNAVLNLAVATLLGLVMGMGASVVREIVDTRIRSVEDSRLVTDLPALGTVPFDRGATDHPLVLEIDPHHTRAESFRSLRTNLLYVEPDKPPRVLVLTSSLPGEGKTTTTVNLALTIAETGSSVCLIEGDLRRPRALEYMGLENAAGLTDVLVGRADLEDVLQPHVANLRVLGCGPIPPNPSELLGSSTMERLLDRLRSQFDYVIIDAPPLLAVTDAAVLSPFADGTIVVVGVGQVRRDQLEQALEALQRVGANVLGLVFNRLPVKGPDAYRYAYESYAPEPAVAPARRRRHRAGLSVAKRG